MSGYNVLFETANCTVMTEYEPQKRAHKAYQSEAELEAEFIRMLCEQGYEYVQIHSEADLILNLRRQIEALNKYQFTDSEWNRFFVEHIANPNDDIARKTEKVQRECVFALRQDCGTTKNIMLIDKKNVFANRLQVINQYENNDGAHKTRYDVSILVNGLPLVHVELKRRGIQLQEAFNQIERYQRDSFWSQSGLFEYVQIFVISNGTLTKYYSNTTRYQHVKEGRGGRSRQRLTQNSFEFTSYWADAKNVIIPDLVDFTRTFFSRHTILNILVKYCVLTADDKLLVMRPYQIAATERILWKILGSGNSKQVGTINAGGFVWHTTGSGKTLTSFKTAQLATQVEGVDKVLFVVDRKDLDAQTIKEYDRFEKGAANGNRNTAVLKRQLEDKNVKIIVTTIQKLDIFITKNREHPVYGKRVVIIFDECHRSQFGKMHTNIVKHFKNYHIFGFTGTPIFAANTGPGSAVQKTTEQVFGQKLHTYTIVDAITDGNVLPFRIDYVDTMQMGESGSDKRVQAINTEEAWNSPERIRIIVDYILEHFDQKTLRNAAYTLDDKRVKGFNSMFAVSSIAACKAYYAEFKRQLAERKSDLRIATIFSYAPNEGVDANGTLEDDTFETDGLDVSSRDFLDSAIDDYNEMFGTNYSTDGTGFQDYYENLAHRIKTREIDLVIVVNMFLTGFDAKTLNTLWVDKNLKMHGLVQAFSRTNRILNTVKSYGNIVCFRNLEQETNDAISLFGDKTASGIVLMRPYEEYYYGYTDDAGNEIPGYEHYVQKLYDEFPLSQRIVGEQTQKDFLVLFGKILRLGNILSAFDQFDGNAIIDRDFQDYLGIYHDIYADMKNKENSQKDSITDDIVFEAELAKQVEVNVDYILMLVEKFHDDNCEDKSIDLHKEIERAIQSSVELRSKRELIEGFIRVVTVGNGDVVGQWRKYVQAQYEANLREVINTQKLDPEKTFAFMQNALSCGEVKTYGTDIVKLMGNMSPFGAAAKRREEKKRIVIEQLQQLLNQYYGIT